MVLLSISFLIRPVNPKFSIKIATINSHVLWGLFDYAFKLSINKQTLDKIYKHSFNKNYLVISNHTSSIDFMILNALNKQNYKHNKYAVKPLWFIPLFYQGMRLLEFLVLKRNFEIDKESIKKYIKKMIKLKVPMWFIIFPEGHRITLEHQKESYEFCRGRGIEPYCNVLSPRYKGFDILTRGLQGDDMNRNIGEGGSVEKVNRNRENVEKVNRNGKNVNRNGKNVNRRGENAYTKSKNVHRLDQEGYVKEVLDLTIYWKGEVPSLFDMMLKTKRYELKYDVRVVPIREIQNPKEFLEGAFRRKDEMIRRWKLEALRGK